MIYLTQLIFVIEGKEEAFNQFEDLAIPLLEDYEGKMIYRIKPEKKAFITANEEVPYEIHFISFPDDLFFQSFMLDKKRQEFIHLKEESIRFSYLIKGKKTLKHFI